MQIELLLDENNYIKEYNSLIQYSHISDSITIELSDEQFNSHFIQNYKAYQYINNQLIFDENYQQKLIEENNKERIRTIREIECFTKIDRSPMWYTSLTTEQIQELEQWYRAWLDAPETLEIPNKPEWL